MDSTIAVEVLRFLPSDGVHSDAVVEGPVLIVVGFVPSTGAGWEGECALAVRAAAAAEGAGSGDRESVPIYVGM